MPFGKTSTLFSNRTSDLTWCKNWSPLVVPCDNGPFDVGPIRHGAEVETGRERFLVVVVSASAALRLACFHQIVSRVEVVVLVPRHRLHQLLHIVQKDRTIRPTGAFAS